MKQCKLKINEIWEKAQGITSEVNIYIPSLENQQHILDEAQRRNLERSTACARPATSKTRRSAVHIL